MVFDVLDLEVIVNFILLSIRHVLSSGAYL